MGHSLPVLVPGSSQRPGLDPVCIQEVKKKNEKVLETGRESYPFTIGQNPDKWAQPNKTGVCNFLVTQ